mmetsp:Transcript_47403/g.127902  ORF Transcript_47403/g.127902 Transcript_47403/m.127902 type:complete len:204 (-) Transcript_47403:1788-2399(-)
MEAYGKSHSCQVRWIWRQPPLQELLQEDNVFMQRLHPALHRALPLLQEVHALLQGPHPALHCACRVVVVALLHPGLVEPLRSAHPEERRLIELLPGAAAGPVDRTVAALRHQRALQHETHSATKQNCGNDHRRQPSRRHRAHPDGQRLHDKEDSHGRDHRDERPELRSVRRGIEQVAVRIEHALPLCEPVHVNVFLPQHEAAF